eukprot:TRINITY_DN6461_c0_g1_i2.p1 TRINITY_DN6461_c0_g1~~TRINITY_DN6461_c0_g1_i2.p1  ORF type:complete len:386 (-),score=57.56 TRINITY_DN6461_c0_g1_i2:84-1241(-)
MGQRLSCNPREEDRSGRRGHDRSTMPFSSSEAPTQKQKATPWYGTVGAGLVPGGAQFGEDAELRKHDDLEESAYTAALGTFVKDLQRISKRSPYAGIRVARMFVSLLILWMLIGMQLYMLIQVKTFVTSPAVREVRTSYDEFERHMYDGHVRESGFGFALGVGGPNGPHFDAKRFDSLPGGVKEKVCLIPFSQLPYLCVILLIWSLTIAGELRTATRQLRWIFAIKNVSFEDSLERDGDVEVVTGLPVAMKAFTVVFLLLPRILVAFCLLWLGCRWLAATLDFAEVLINAIALEFVIGLNELLYRQLMSDRNKRELASLKLDFAHEDGGEPTLYSFMGAFVWAIFAVAWVYLYVNHLQMVLPGYNWDVRASCAGWISERYNFWRI